MRALAVVVLRMVVRDMIMPAVHWVHVGVRVLDAIPHAARLGWCSVSRWTQHGRSHRAPDREQDGEQDHEPETQQLHRERLPEQELQGCFEMSFRHRKPCSCGKVKRVERNSL